MLFKIKRFAWTRESILFSASLLVSLSLSLFSHFIHVSWSDDWGYASSVASQFKVPLEAVPLQREYFDLVIEKAIHEVSSGRTPNPDILCNSLIKFGMFYDKIGKDFQKIITGHYAGTMLDRNGNTHLKRATDRVKDQTYFLSQLSQNQISRASFPLANLKKPEVRNLAKEFGLSTQNRKDSQGLCFLGKLNWNDFLSHYIKNNPGPICESGTGRVLGGHKGLHFHTIGQRKGVGLLLSKDVHMGPWYVSGKDIKENILYISNRQIDSDEKHESCGGTSSPVILSDRHLLLGNYKADYSTNFLASSSSSEYCFEVAEMNWISPSTIPSIPPEGVRMSVQLRHGPTCSPATIFKHQQENGFQQQSIQQLPLSKLKIYLDFPDQAISPGQYAALDSMLRYMMAQFVWVLVLYCDLKVI